MDRSSLVNRLLRRLLGSPPAVPGAPAVEQRRITGETPSPMTRRVSLIIYNPTVPNQGGRKLNQVLGWNDPDRLAAAFNADLREVSHGFADYQIVERIEVDEFPPMLDGYQYTAGDYLRFWRAHHGFHQPDAVNYHYLLAQNDILAKVNQGQIDEVWMIFYPYGGLYESRMAGPDAFWCNAPPLEDTQPAGRRFVIMCFNYERGVGEMLESYGHRVESILAQTFAGIPDPDNLWNRFTRYDKIAPRRAEVGTIHFAPNSRKDYDWGNPTPVLSGCRNWPYFPDLSAPPVTVTCAEWGNGDIRAHHRWWLNLLPHVAGQTGTIANNWWAYSLDPNLVV